MAFGFLIGRGLGIVFSGVLTLSAAAVPNVASATTLASYSSFANVTLSVTGLRTAGGVPIDDDAVRVKGSVAGGDNYQEIFIRDTDGNYIDPPAPEIAQVGLFGGELFDNEYYVSLFSIIFDHRKSFSFENVSEDFLYAALRLELSASADASSTVQTAKSHAEASVSGAWFLYFQNSDGGYFGAEERLSPEAIAALESGISAEADSDGETSVSNILSHDFEFLLEPGDTFHAETFLMPVQGDLENTPAPVPLPAGAPLLLAALGALALPRMRRRTAR